MKVLKICGLLLLGILVGFILANLFGNPFS